MGVDTGKNCGIILEKEKVRKMKTKFAVGDVVRVSWDSKVIYCRIIDQKNGSFLVEPVGASDTGKVQTRWVRGTWILEG